MITIIIPLYNKAQYIHKALDSVLAQTYTDYECIIVNDGSTDDSLQVTGNWIQDTGDYERFRVVDKENGGVSSARNRGVQEAKGEYIAFLDGDDWWEKDFLNEMMNFAAQYPDAGLWACNYIYYKPGKTRVAIQNISTGYFNYPQAYYQGDMMPITSISILTTRAILDSVGGFPQGIRLGEDFLTWSKIAMHHKVAFLNQPLAYYNNAIPASARATRNLHTPQTHMLWQMDFIPEVGDWKLLKDKLRVNGLMDYWLANRYHAEAKQELSKVDWSMQSSSVRMRYRMPLFAVRGWQRIMKWGSVIKQKLLRK